ncbi:hypothetical protein D0Y50_06570 [Salinimonas sediminis]|uniref:Uncharacterized protein n=1 Tax=Salinimonas sediminis TaxID=2303538 RepID=A0A346NKL0_9ALTE|nr:hypothetical protein D0Y50_06570 [Salinimonas sediminis]
MRAGNRDYILPRDTSVSHRLKQANYFLVFPGDGLARALLKGTSAPAAYKAGMHSRAGYKTVCAVTKHTIPLPHFSKACALGQARVIRPSFRRI